MVTKEYKDKINLILDEIDKEAEEGKWDNK